MQYQKKPSFLWYSCLSFEPGKPGFSMVYYGVNQAINDKKSVIKIQNSRRASGMPETAL